MNDYPMDKMKFETSDLTAGNIDKIAALFPNCITETRDERGQLKKAVNFEMLKQMLSDEVIDGQEAYEFTWVGKKAAMVEANRPIRKTLRPCPEESVNWDTTENLYIEGDNLDVLKLLQESYLGKVKVIYIDPPYNTGKDFIYKDNFSTKSEDYKLQSGEIDEIGDCFVVNSNTEGKFHSNWCSMMYSRLLLARNLLNDSGIIIISINDNEISNLISICNNVFGNNNFLACFPRITKKSGKTSDAIAQNHDYLVTYKKSTDTAFYLPLHNDDSYQLSDEYEQERGKYKLTQPLDYDSLSYSSSLDYPIKIDGEIFYPGNSYDKYLERKNGKHARADWAWRWSKKTFEFGLQNDFIVVKKYNNHSRIYTKTYQNCKIASKGHEIFIEYFDRTKHISTLEFIDNIFSNDNATKNIAQLFNRKLFDYSKPTMLLNRLLRYTMSKNDIVLDFFSGSATTAHAVMQLNAEDGGSRKFIMVQLPEPCSEKSEARKAGFATIAEIGKERIRRAGQKILAEMEQKSQPEAVSLVERERERAA